MLHVHCMLDTANIGAVGLAGAAFQTGNVLGEVCSVSGSTDQGSSEHYTVPYTGKQGVHVKVLHAIMDKLYALDPSQTFIQPVPASVPG